MQLVDVNVLIYAHRTEAAEHSRYEEWMEELLNRDEPFAWCDIVLAGFVRIVTNPGAMRPATSMATALAACQRIIDAPRANRVTPGLQHWGIFTRLCAGIRGPLVADAYLAALAIEHGCEWITTDSNFARFPGLRWRHPLADL